MNLGSRQVVGGLRWLTSGSKVPGDPGGPVLGEVERLQSGRFWNAERAMTRSPDSIRVDVCEWQEPVRQIA